MDIIWCLHHNFLTLFQKDICSLSLQEVPFTLLKMIRHDQKSSSSKLGERFSASFSQNVTFCPVWLENKVSEVSLELNSIWQSQCTCTHTTLIPGKIRPVLLAVFPSGLILRLFSRMFWRNIEIGVISSLPLVLLFLFCTAQMRLGEWSKCTGRHHNHLRQEEAEVPGGWWEGCNGIKRGAHKHQSWEYSLCLLVSEQCYLIEKKLVWGEKNH